MEICTAETYASTLIKTKSNFSEKESCGQVKSRMPWGVRRNVSEGPDKKNGNES